MLEVELLFDKRTVLVTGKGGVGRSTLTAAIAIAAARSGRRVLVAEIGDGGDDQSALAHLFGLSRLPRTAEEIAPGIHGSQLVPDEGAERFLASILKIAAIAKTAVGFEPLRRFLTAAPSLREMGIFFHLLTYLRALRKDGSLVYDFVVIDMPATGHTLALTGLPEVLLRVVTRGPIADALREGQAHLNDPAKAAAYVVTLPETLPVTEAIELIEGLRKTSMPVGGVLVNRVRHDPFLSEERAALETYLAVVPLHGMDRFRQMANAKGAISRLRSSTEVSCSELPDIALGGHELVARLARHLSEHASRSSAP